MKLVLTLVSILLHIIYAEDKRFKFDLEAYRQPTFFWPLDYSTWVREIIENKNPIVQGGSSLGISGKGRGYLRFPLHSASVNLDSYKSKCLTSPAECDSNGLTLSFWVRLTSFKLTKKYQEFTFLRTVSNSIEKQTTLAFTFKVQESNLKLAVRLYGSSMQTTIMNIKANHWNQVMIAITSNSMKAYLNTQMQIVSAAYNKNYRAFQSVKMEIGLYPDLPAEIDVFENSDINLDNLAIWNRILTNQEREELYFVEFGETKPTCITKPGHLQILWNPLNDVYTHVTGYSVTWAENGKAPSTMTIPYKIGQKISNLKADIEAFIPNTTYKFMVVTDFLGKQQLKHPVQCIIGTSKNPNFQLFSDSPLSIYVKWISPKANYLYEIFIDGTRIEQSNKNSLDFQIKDLKEDTHYDLAIKRVNLVSGQRTEYKESVKTLSIVDTMTKSVVNATVKRNTWNETEIYILLHRSLKGKPVTYYLISNEVSNKGKQGKRIPWDNTKMMWLTFTLRNLDPNTLYTFDVELRNQGSNSPGPRMSKPLIWRTKEKFPSLSQKVLSVDAKKVTLLLSYSEANVSYSAATMIRIVAKSRAVKIDAIRIIPIVKGGIIEYTISGLEPYTEYMLTSALGDGIEFGNETNPLTVKTKDLNECTELKDICGQNTNCTNTLGSYVCKCISGYEANTGNLKGCKDIDECKNKDRCSVNEHCINTPGTFQCRCKTGFVRFNGICLAEQVEITKCKFETLRNITWMTVEAGQTVNQSCPEGYQGLAYRTCAMKGKKARWNKPDSSECVNKALAVLLKNQEKGNTNVIATSLNAFVKKQEKKMTSGDVSVIVNMMGNLMTVDSENDVIDEKKQEEFAENMIGVTSGLLEPQTRDVWTNFNEEERNAKASGLLNAADNIIEVSANVLKKNNTRKKIIKTENVVMEIQRVQPSASKDESVRVSEDVELPSDALGTGVTIAVVKYNGMDTILGVPRNTTLRGSKNITGTYLNSPVTAISIFPRTKKTFDRPVVFNLQHGGLKNDSKPHCVYWHDESPAVGGYWSDDGCFVGRYNESHVTCNCYHLTNFAILMSVTEASKDLSATDEMALSLITIIGITISLGALIISFFSFMFIKTIRSLRNTVHKHLCVALFMAEIIFLFGIDKTGYKIGCQVIAASLHYFFLVAFFIMGLEGIVLYLMLVRVYRSMGTSGYGSPKFIALCWVLPIVIITVNLFIDQNAYGDIHGACWLSIRNGFIWSFVGPVVMVILMNFVILGLTLKVMSDKAKRRSTAAEEIWFWTKGVCLLLSILGVTWVFGVLYVDSNTVFFAYIFSIINSLQGLSIFVFHCACDPRVRKAYRDFIFCTSMRQKHELMRSMSRTRSTSGSKSSLKKSPHNVKVNTNKKREHVPLYSNGSSTPENSFGLLVGTKNF